MFRICQVKAARASLSLPSFESEIDACQLFFFLPHHPFTDFFRQIIHIPHPTISDMQAEVGGGKECVGSLKTGGGGGSLSSTSYFAYTVGSSEGFFFFFFFQSRRRGGGGGKAGAGGGGKRGDFSSPPPPYPCLLPPLSIHRLRPSPSLVFFPKSKQGREVSPSIQVEEGEMGRGLGRRRKE